MAMARDREGQAGYSTKKTTEDVTGALANTGERPAMTARKPHHIDVHVGSRVRLRRMFIGMSQERLGEKMNLTFQQIQKYEKGTNRIGASRLFQLAEVLKVPVGFFFEGLESAGQRPGELGFAEPASESYVMGFLDSREGVELNRAFVRIKDPKIRKSIVDMVRAMADTEDNAG
jgi:transcriptional regulator with XRE-family HTH domain